MRYFALNESGCYARGGCCGEVVVTGSNAPALYLCLLFKRMYLNTIECRVAGLVTISLLLEIAESLHHRTKNNGL